MELPSLRYADAPAHERHELDATLLAMFAAVPLYVTGAIAPAPLIVFHALMALLLFTFSRRIGHALLGSGALRALGFGYLFLYLFDVIVISRSAIRSSTHLLLFIAFYQAAEAQNVIRTAGESEAAITYRNRLLRLLVTAFLFVASVATSTHQSVTVFIIAFAFLLFRHLIDLSRIATAAQARGSQGVVPSTRAAFFFVAVAAGAAILLFPLLPRVRDPLVPGIASALQNASTGLSDTIDFNSERSISSDPLVMARVWMRKDAVVLLTPIRLRGRVYDLYENGVWGYQQVNRGVPLGKNGWSIAKPVGTSRTMTVQQRLLPDLRLLVPSGAHTLRGPGRLLERPAGDVYTLLRIRNGLASYEADVSRSVLPLSQVEPLFVDYPITPQVEEFARRIVGSSTAPLAKGAKIESHLASRFRYVADPAEIGRQMTLDDFLLREKRGHCEYFAAGMVVLLKAAGVPARIVGGFYGGQLNPFTGYFVLRKSDAHAWVEIFDGGKWVTFDPTPADLRPGSAAAGLLSAYATAIGESINYFWDRYILTFGLADQVAILSSLIGQIRTAASGFGSMTVRIARFVSRPEALLLPLTLFFAAIPIRYWLRRRRSIFAALTTRLARGGISITPSTTAAELLSMLREKYPHHGATVERVVAIYELDRFAVTRPKPDAVANARRDIASLEF